MRIAQLLGIPTADQVAKLIAPVMVENLDKYHREWAGFNREIEGRVLALEKGGSVDVAEVLALKNRIQALEDDRTKLRVDVQGTLEVAERLFNRIRMRQTREQAGERDEPQDDLLLMRKGIR